MSNKGRISRTVAFNTLNLIRAGRATELSAATNQFIVRRVNKDGSLDRTPMKQTDWQFNAFSGLAEAQKRAEELVKLNPGMTFKVATRNASGQFEAV